MSRPGATVDWTAPLLLEALLGAQDKDKKAVEDPSKGGKKKAKGGKKDDDDDLLDDLISQQGSGRKKPSSKAVKRPAGASRKAQGLTIAGVLEAAEAAYEDAAMAGRNAYAPVAAALKAPKFRVARTVVAGAGKG